jgi:hypothetical protein
MPHALTLATMSPGLLQGVATRSHEPHRRKSRMWEIRSSGSGEGPGRVTARPTLQRYFATAPSGRHPLGTFLGCVCADSLPRRARAPAAGQPCRPQAGHRPAPQGTDRTGAG